MLDATDTEAEGAIAAVRWADFRRIEAQIVGIDA
jgi:hypothetical protein